MEAQGFVLNDEALRNERRVEFRGRSQADAARPLAVKYTDAFPSMPPRVFLESNEESLKRHYNPNTQEVCLFGPGQPRWSASLSGTAALEEANRVIRLFSPGRSPDADDAVPEPATAAFQCVPDAAILVPPGPSALAIASGDKVVVGKFWFRFMGRPYGSLQSEFPGRGVVLEVRFADQVARSEDFYQKTFIPEGQVITAPLVYVPAPPPALRDSESFARWLLDLGIKREKWMAFLFPEESGSVGVQRWAWLTVHSTPQKIHLIRTFLLRPDEREVRIPGTGGLAEKKIVLIGCGSLGSKIAVSLAATGVTRFALVDPDFVEPHNSVRHEVGVDQFGSPKVGAVLHRIFSINPWASEKDRWEGLGNLIGGINDASQEGNLWKQMANADLVVETTGLHGVTRFVNDVCHELRVPILVVSVTNGAWAGEIVRIIPGETPCWQCWLDQFHENHPPAAPIPDQGVFAPGCDQPTFTGTTYDIGIVGNIAASVAVETMLRDDSTRKGFEADYIRWLGRDEAGKAIMTVEMFNVTRRRNCPFCSAG